MWRDSNKNLLHLHHDFGERYTGTLVGVQGMILGDEYGLGLE